MKSNKAYKYRIYPNKSQAMLIDLTFKYCRMIWNLMLDDRENEYKEYKETHEHRKLLTPASFKAKYPFFKQVDCFALCWERLHLRTAYSRFFNHLGRHPHYKKASAWKQSYTTYNRKKSVRIKNGHLDLPKLHGIRIALSREIPKDHTVKDATVSKDPAGRYFVSLLTEYQTDIKPHVIDKAIGLDYSMPDMFVSSNKDVIVDQNYIHNYRKAQSRLSFLKRRLSKKQRGSNRYLKCKARIARFESHIANKRKDYAHKLSHMLASRFDLVAIETLNMKAMSMTFHFGKSVGDNGWGQFVGFLNYKLHDRGKVLSKVGKWYPSSKTCHDCGYVNHGLTLKDRSWTCPSCHHHISRDYNAALNIRDEGLRLVRA